MEHLVSIIMPAYNAEKYIAGAIRSVLDQTRADWELIVIDDGSTDGTAEVARGFASADDRIKLVSQRNGGQSSARNAGIRNSRGDIVAFLDADDLWLREKLELQLAVMEGRDADVVSSNGFIFREGSGEDEPHGFTIVPGLMDGERMFKLLYENNKIQIQSVLVRRKVLEDAGLFDEDRRYQNCEDYDLWLTLARRGAVFYGMEEKLIRYRRHATASTYHDSNMLGPMIAVMKKHGDHPGLERDEVKRRIRNLYRTLVLALVKEDKLPEARRRMEEFAAWDEGCLITRLQKIALAAWPRKFNFISRECLFRVEWHVNTLLGRPNVAF